MIKAAGFRYIPKGAIKVADKQSDAVAYLYEQKGKPCGRVFYGKQSKPVMAYQFPNEVARAEAVAKYFRYRQEAAARKVEQRAKAKAGRVKLEAGAFFYTSWGYEQTNIDWYMVVELVGKCSAKVVKVAGMDASNGNEGWMQGKSIPGTTPVGEPFLVRANQTGFKVDRHTAFPWDGVPKHWTAYA